MYESPVKIIQDQIKMDMENEVMKAVLRCNIDVNKAEPLKALKFDREQYDKGFSDCKAIYEKKLEKILERLEEKAEKEMANSEKAAELGRAYEKHMILYGAKGMAFEDAIEIIREEGGIE